MQFAHLVFSHRIILTASVKHFVAQAEAAEDTGMMRVPVFCVVVLLFICHSHSLEIQNPAYGSKR